MDSYAYSFKDVSAPRLQALLIHLNSAFGQAILESVTEVQMVSISSPPGDFRFDSSFDAQTWERGRAFGPGMEARWRRSRTGYAVLVVSDEMIEPPEDGMEGLEMPDAIPLTKEPEEIPVVLWGELQDPDNEHELPGQDLNYWYEARVPRFLAYPWSGDDERLVLKAARYSTPAQEASPGDCIYRFVCLDSLYKGG